MFSKFSNGKLIYSFPFMITYKPYKSVVMLDMVFFRYIFSQRFPGLMDAKNVCMLEVTQRLFFQPLILPPHNSGISLAPQ